MSYVAMPGVLVRDLPVGKALIIPGEDSIFEFNEVSGYVWDLLQKPISQEGIVSSLIREYQVPIKEARGDVNNLIKQLLSLNLIEQRS